MTDQGFALFDTAIGQCGVIWSGRGILGIQLPERDERATRARIGRQFPDAHEAPPPSPVQHTIDAITALLDGTPSDLSAVALDMSGVPEFHRRVYEVARTVPPGRTVSYGDIATRLGEPGAARAVGQALGANPYPIIVPCHRVVTADGRPGGFSARGGATTKLRLLSIEDAYPGNAPTLF